MGLNDKIEVKRFDNSETLKALAAKSNADGNEYLEKTELSVFRGYVNDAEAKNILSADDKTVLKEVMGFTPVARSLDTPVQGSKQDDAPKAEAEVKTDNYSKAYAEYREQRAAGKGPYAAYKAVKKAHKDDKEFDTAISKLKVQARDIDAQTETIEAIGKSETTKSKKQVKNDAEAVLSEQDGGKIDKWHKRALNGNNNIVTWLSGQDSAMKELRRGQLYGNRAEKIKEDGVSMEDIVKKLGEDCPYLQKTTNANGEQVTLLQAAGLIKPREDGKYDISELSNFVYINGTGGDNSQSRQENKSVRERKLLTAELNAKIKETTGVDLSDTKVKDKYSKRMVKLTGRHIEKKNVLKEAYLNTIGGAAAAAAGTAGALFLQPKDIFRGTATNKNYLDLTLNFKGFSNIEENLGALTNDPTIKKMIADGTATLSTNGTSINIVIDQTQSQPFIHAASKHYLGNILRSAAIGAAIGMLSSALSYGKSEQEVIPHKTDCKTYDEYVTYIDSMVTNKAVKPLYGEIAKKVAFSFIDENGVFQCQEMNKFLGYEASNGSRLNRAELMRALIDRQKKVEKTPEPPKVEEVKTEKTYWGGEKTEEGEVVKTPVPKTEKFEDWGVFASRYECLEDYDPKFKKVYDSILKKNVPNTYARTMMKVMQAITDDNYDLDRLQDLTVAAMSKNWRGELSKVQGFDLKLYEALRGNKKTGTFGMDKQNLPTITMVNGNNERSVICTPEAPKYEATVVSGGTGKKTNIGGANNRSKSDDKYEGGLETSDGQKVKAKNHADYVAKKQALEQQGYKWKEK